MKLFSVEAALMSWKWSTGRPRKSSLFVERSHRVFCGEMSQRTIFQFDADLKSPRQKLGKSNQLWKELPGKRQSFTLGFYIYLSTNSFIWREQCLRKQWSIPMLIRSNQSFSLNVTLLVHILPNTHTQLVTKSINCSRVQKQTNSRQKISSTPIRLPIAFDESHGNIREKNSWDSSSSW